MSRRWLVPGSLLVPVAFAGLKLLLHALAITNYGYFRDELYYIACSNHLAWGYVDQPPLSIAVLAVVRGVLGDSLVALRALPALTGAASVLLTGLIARDLGGGRFAQALACLCALLAPVWLAVDHFYSMNAFDTFFWSLSAWLLLRALDGNRLRWWAALGLVMGLGLLNKTSMLWFGGGVALGLVATGHRRVLRTPGPWLAATISAACFAPYVMWQWQNGWPTLEFMRNAAGGKMVRTGFLAFWSQQWLVMNPVTSPVWAIGLVALLAHSRVRVVGIAFLAVSALLIASGSSRPNYLAVAYAPLFAAGAVAIARFAHAPGRAWLKPTTLAVLLLAGAPVVPMGLPFLPVDRLVAYLQAVGMRPRPQEHTAEGDLPQVFADMFGWEDMVRRVARVFHGLPPDQRARCAIFTMNYGQAGAIDFFGPRYGLPPAISAHNNYWLWGPRGATGEVVIIVGGRRDDPHADFRSVVLADTTRCDHCMPYENGAPIFVCLGLNQPLSRRWLEIRHYE
jgi:4-amino-4-deoxy-L-arabinose transferase-like glycosyltransferase